MWPHAGVLEGRPADPTRQPRQRLKAEDEDEDEEPGGGACVPEGGMGQNGFPNYSVTMRNTLQEEQLQNTSERGAGVPDKLAEKIAFKSQQEDLEGVMRPVMLNVYQAPGGGACVLGGGVGQNGIEWYCFMMRNALQGVQVQAASEGGDKHVIGQVVQETLGLAWATLRSQLRPGSRRS